MPTLFKDFSFLQYLFMATTIWFRLGEDRGYDKLNMVKANTHGMIIFRQLKDLVKVGKRLWS